MHTVYKLANVFRPALKVGREARSREARSQRGKKRSERLEKSKRRAPEAKRQVAEGRKTGRPERVFEMLDSRSLSDSSLAFQRP